MRIRVVLCAVAMVLISAPLTAQGPPSSSGPIVVRGEFAGGDYDWWYGVVDGGRGLVSIHGVELVSWCMGAPVGYNMWDFQDNFPPADEGLVHEMLKADDVLTQVWPISILFDPDFCVPVLAMGAPLAEGTTDVIVNDNDVWAWLYYHDRANAFMMSAHGVVYDPDGERMILNAGWHCVWRMGNPIPGAHCRDRVVLR